MHVDEPLRTGPLMHVVDVLGDDQKLARPFLVEAREG
jgi:hypothetical protein